MLSFLLIYFLTRLLPYLSMLLPEYTCSISRQEIVSDDQTWLSFLY